jgi:hypothetical protein
MWGLRDEGPKRMMVWGQFDDFIVAEIPAKELRKHVRAKGVVAAEDEYKAFVLERAIEDWLADAAPPSVNRRGIVGAHHDHEDDHRDVGVVGG